MAWREQLGEGGSASVFRVCVGERTFVKVKIELELVDEADLETKVESTSRQGSYTSRDVCGTATPSATAVKRDSVDWPRLGRRRNIAVRSAKVQKPP